MYYVCVVCMAILTHVGTKYLIIKKKYENSWHSSNREAMEIKHMYTANIQYFRNVLRILFNIWKNEVLRLQRALCVWFPLSQYVGLLWSKARNRYLATAVEPSRATELPFLNCLNWGIIFFSTVFMNKVTYFKMMHRSTLHCRRILKSTLTSVSVFPFL